MLNITHDVCRRDIMTLAAICHHRLFPRFAIFTGGASALAIVLTAGAVLSTTSDARTASTPTLFSSGSGRAPRCNLAARDKRLITSVVSAQPRWTRSTDVHFTRPSLERSDGILGRRVRRRSRGCTAGSTTTAARLKGRSAKTGSVAKFTP